MTRLGYTHLKSCLNCHNCQLSKYIGIGFSRPLNFSMLHVSSCPTMSHMSHLWFDPERNPGHHDNQAGGDVGVEHKVPELR